MNTSQPDTNSVTDTIVLPDHHIAEAKREDSKKSRGWKSMFKKKHSKTVTTTVHEGGKREKMPAWQKIGIGILVVILVIGSVVGVLAYHTLSIVKNIQAQTNDLKVSAGKVKDQLKAQNLPGAKIALTEVQTKLDGVKAEYTKLSYLSVIPVASQYYQDGTHGFAAAEAGVRAGTKTVDAIVPYADVLGFSGEGSFTGGTAEDRIRLLLQTLSKISPVIDDITNEFKTVDKELAYINPQRYPDKYKDIEIKSNLIAAQQGVKDVVAGIEEFRPALEVIPEIAGSEGKRKKYLLIFQNDNELRPTGGFMTGYAVLFVENGKVYPEKSDDIYELDKKFKSKIAIPPVLGRYLTSEKYFNLRDMNISPDFKVSMDTFLSYYLKLKDEPKDLDGVITLDTDVLSALVKVLGPVDVPGYGTFTADTDKRCDCPQIIYALSEIVDRPTTHIREDRKGILAPMMQSILHKSYTSPKELWPQIFAIAREKIEEKHVQMYFFDKKHQAAAEAINVGGRMNPIKEGYDYTALVDANLGGAKSNLFVTEEVEQKISPVENGMITKTLTIKYKNPFPGSNCNLEAGQLCLNAVLKDWVRIYVPKGATITNTNGFDSGTYSEGTEEEFPDLKVIQGVFKLSPQSNSSIVINYQVPYTDTKTYKLQIRKQGGTSNFKYLIDVNGEQKEILLNKDQTVEIPF